MYLVTTTMKALIVLFGKNPIGYNFISGFTNTDNSVTEKSRSIFF